MKPCLVITTYLLTCNRATVKLKPRVKTKLGAWFKTLIICNVAPKDLCVIFDYQTKMVCWLSVYRQTCCIVFVVISILEKVIKTGYKALQLEYFFTAGKDEVRAWTIQVSLHHSLLRETVASLVEPQIVPSMTLYLCLKVVGSEIVLNLIVLLILQELDERYPYSKLRFYNTCKILYQKVCSSRVFINWNFERQNSET